MDIKDAKKLIKKTKRDFEKIALQFSYTRIFPRPEMKYFAGKYLKPHQKILDIGCGNGLFFELIKDKEINYTGIDSSKKLISFARKKYPRTKFLVKNALELNFKKNYFDLIFSFAFLHHIPSESLRLNFLQNIYKLLKPKGYFICTCWNSFAGRKMKSIKTYKFTTR